MASEVQKLVNKELNILCLLESWRYLDRCRMRALGMQRSSEGRCLLLPVVGAVGTLQRAPWQDLPRKPKRSWDLGSTTQDLQSHSGFQGAEFQG